MKMFWQRLKQSVGFWLALVLMVQSGIYAVAGARKAYIHMDEAFSLALAQYDKISITENADFYNTWHNKEYYQDYLAVQEKDEGNWRPVYENQKNDVHPPLYYVLLRGVMELTPGEFSKWPGIILNIVIMAGNTIFLYLISCKLLVKEKNAKYKALALAGLAGLTVAGVSTVVYIRMYGLLTLMVLWTLWLHLRLWGQKSPGMWNYAVIAVAAVLGTLTQYYYLFFLCGLVLAMVIRYVRMKAWKQLGRYVGSLALAGGAVLLLWPHILQHMFFGYRGQGVLKNLFDPTILIGRLWDYVLLVDYNVFHHLLLLILLGMVSLAVYRWRKHLKLEHGEGFWLALWPTFSYFGLAAVASPFIELRYIMPVCGLIFALVMCELYWLWDKVVKERVKSLAVLGAMILVIFAFPMQIGLGWMRVELLYRDRQAVMELVRKRSDVPILYFITTENNRFLDNILPFAVSEQSYLALDLLQPTVEEVREILQGKDLSAGLIMFVSSSQNQQEALDAVQRATGLQNVDWVQGINTCDVYYLQ